MVTYVTMETFMIGKTRFLCYMEYTRGLKKINIEHDINVSIFNVVVLYVYREHEQGLVKSHKIL